VIVGLVADSSISVLQYNTIISIQRGVTMSENLDLRNLLRGHSNKWVALTSDSDRVVGVADNIEDAIKEARSNNEENPILTRTPEHYGTFIL